MDKYIYIYRLKIKNLYVFTESLKIYIFIAESIGQDG